MTVAENMTVWWSRRPPRLDSSHYLVTANIDGKRYLGIYFLERGRVTVSYGGSSTRSAKLGEYADDPDALARLMLRELAKECRSRHVHCDAVG